MIELYEAIHQDGDEEIKIHVLAVDEDNARAYLTAQGITTPPFRVGVVSVTEEVQTQFTPDVVINGVQWQPV